jgi:hypothetical protein
MAAGRQLGQTRADLCAVESRKGLVSWVRCDWTSSLSRPLPFEGDERYRPLVDDAAESLSVVEICWSSGCSSGFDQSRGFLADAVSPDELIE